MGTQGHKFVFVGGLHRSGTTLLHDCLQDHPAISGFLGTGVPENEGQHLQRVYPTAEVYGGPGRFGFDPEAHLTEASPLVSNENRARLLADWMKHWDPSRPVLLEKSPPNLIRTRFLQALFPDALFIIMKRHPIAVTLATQKWSGTPVRSLLNHWFTCHETFERDRASLRNVIVVRYEDFVADPHPHLRKIYSALGLDDYPCSMVINDSNPRYFDMWDSSLKALRRGTQHNLVAQFEVRALGFGYSLLRMPKSAAKARRAADPAQRAERVGRSQMIVLLRSGLYPDSKVLEVGCGSLRRGYWLIHFLRPGHYFGLDGHRDAVTAGIREFLTPELVAEKAPAFAHNAEYNFEVFGVKFDYVVARAVWPRATDAEIRTMLDSFVATRAPSGVMLASYVRAEQTAPGRQRLDWIEAECRSRGLAVQELPGAVIHHQRWLRIE